MLDINEITIERLSELYEAGEVTVNEVVLEYLDRIGRLDQDEDGLNSVLEVNSEAVKIAKQLDGQRTGKPGKLFGIPILLKDNINTADHMHTSAGSLALAELKAPYDADVVKILRRKGAVILGKTNMTEFANHMTIGMPPGYSSRGGQVKSPYKEGADPSGSSTGSAVAVTTNLCMASIGTDTSNSIVSPALKNSIVGFRPGMGTISQRGIIPISFTCDTAGPMTRTVRDTILLYSELTGADIDMKLSEDLHKIKIGINEWALKNMDQEEVKKAETILTELKEAKAELTYLDIEPLPTDLIKTIQKYEFKFSMNKYLNSLPKDFPIRSLKDIIEFNNRNAELTLKYGQTMLTEAEEKTRGNLSEDEYITVLKDREQKKRQVTELYQDIDVCIMFMENTLLQYTGLPILALPRGLKNDQTPYGIILTSLTDDKLLKHSLMLEKLIGRRVVPKLDKSYALM